MYNLDKNLLRHVLAWTVFIIYEISVVVVFTGNNGIVLDYLLHYVLNIALFYLNSYIIFKYGLPKLKFAKLILGVVSEVVFYLLLNFFLNRFLESLGMHIVRPTHPFKIFILASTWRCIYFLGLSLGYAYAVNALNSNKEIINLTIERFNSLQKQKTLENDLLKLKNAYLQLQINPHLLFNTLNFIYNTVRKSSSEGGEAVMLLSEITRYTYVSTTKTELQDIEEEILQVENLIKLNQIRFHHQLNINFSNTVPPGNFKILPIIFLTFVENIFKYADLTDSHNPALITITIVNNEIVFYTFNKKKPTNQEFSSSGTGIKNSELRLSNFYEDNYRLDIVNTPDFFELHLEIKHEV